jgi:signal transduction histidine kinase
MVVLRRLTGGFWGNLLAVRGNDTRAPLLRQGRLLAAATLTTAILLTVALLVLPGRVAPGLPRRFDPMVWTAAYGIPASLAIYLLNRAGHTKPAAWAYVFVTFDLLWLFTILTQGSGYFVGNYAYLVFTVILAAMFLPAWATAGYAVANLAGVWAFNRIYDLRVEDLYLSYAYIAVFSALLLVTSGLLRRNESDLARQAADIARQAADHETLLAHTDAMHLSLDRALRLVAWNRKASDALIELTGVAPTRGASLLAHLEAPMRLRARAWASKALAGEEVLEDLRFSSPTGPQGVAVFISPIRVDGAVAGLAVSIRDITERLRGEEQRLESLVQKREMELMDGVNKLKTEMLNLASHELNTPLTPMRIEVGLMRNQTQDPQMARRLGIIERNVDRLSGIVGAILQVAQLDRHGFSLDRSSVDADGLVRSRTAWLAPSAQRRGVSLVAETGNGTWLEADAQRLQDALTNLVENALARAPAGSTVTTRVRRESNQVVIETLDAGPAPDSVTAQHLFDSMAVFRDREKGTAGLGLILCRAVAEAHGGRAGCTPAAGATRFWMAFPAGKP